MQYIREYQMTVQAGSDIRKAVEKLDKDIARLEAEREGLSGAEKGAVTRQLTPLVEQRDEYRKMLKKAPPSPMSVDMVYGEVIGELKNDEAQLMDRLDILKASFAKDPQHFIEWQCDDVSKTTVHLQWIRYLLGADKPVGLFVHPVYRLVYLLWNAHQTIRDEIMRNVRGSSVSTNAHANAVAADKQKALVDFLEWNLPRLQQSLLWKWDNAAAWFDVYPEDWQELVDAVHGQHLYEAIGRYEHDVVGTTWAANEAAASAKFAQTLNYYKDRWEAGGHVVRKAAPEKEAQAKARIEEEQVQAWAWFAG